jgi:hypothetical protein
MKGKLKVFGFCFLIIAKVAFGQKRVSGQAKGIIGCGLLGGELTLITEAFLGVKNPWLFTLVPVGVAGGSAIGGYYLEQKSKGGAIATLILGMLMILPTAIIVISQTSYEPSEKTKVIIEELEEPEVLSSEQEMLLFNKKIPFLITLQSWIQDNLFIKN